MTVQVGLSPEQIAMRKGRIGASNTPGILRVSPWSSPFQEFVKILDPESAAVTQTDAMEAGQFLERGILEMFSARHGYTLLPGWTMQHPDHEFIVATPDAILDDPEQTLQMPVECKLVSPKQAEKWKDADGVYRAPAYVRAQHVHQQCVMSVDRGWIVALIFAFEGVKLHSEFVLTSRDERDALIRQLVAFHENHLSTKTPPPVDASAATTDLLVRRHPRGNGQMRTATIEEEAMLAQRLALYESMNELKRQIDQLDNQMRQRIADSDGIEGVARWSNRDGLVRYAQAVKAAGLDTAFLDKFRGAPTRVLKWEIER